MPDEECLHGLTERTCSVCLRGTARSRTPELKVTTCGSCPAEVVWCLTEKGKRMPLDAQPNPVEGRFRVDHFDGDTPVVHFVKNSELEANTQPLYASHFQSCPDRNDWRRSR